VEPVPGEGPAAHNVPLSKRPKYLPARSGRALYSTGRDGTTPAPDAGVADRPAANPIIRCGALNPRVHRTQVSSGVVSSAVKKRKRLFRVVTWKCRPPRREFPTLAAMGGMKMRRFFCLAAGAGGC
jgi:hypothetical protein